MKICGAEGCNIEFNPNTANQKYADSSCRKSLDSLGLCKYRKENGIIEMPKNIVTGETVTSESELKISYTKLLQEYEKLKSKEVHLADAVYRAVREEIDMGNLYNSQNATDATYLLCNKSNNMSYTLGYSAIILRGYYDISKLY